MDCFTIVLCTLCTLCVNSDLCNEEMKDSKSHHLRSQQWNKRIEIFWLSLKPQEAFSHTKEIHVYRGQATKPSNRVFMHLGTFITVMVSRPKE